MSWLFGFGGAPAPAPTPTDDDDTETMMATGGKTLSPSIVARRQRASVPCFSSAKCPPGPGLENSCELPFGFVWTPMAIADTVYPNDETVDLDVKAGAIPILHCPTSALPPVICVTCLAYMNRYCEVQYSKGIWTCTLCGCENVVPRRLLGKDALLAPALTCDQVEYHQPLSVTTSTNHVKEEEEDTCTVVLVVDLNLDKEDAKGIVQALEEVLPKLEDTPKLKLGLVVFDDTVAMYQLGMAGVASADVYTPNTDLEDEEPRRKALEERAYLQTIRGKEDLESLSNCLSAVFGVSVEKSSSQKKKSQSRAEVLKQRKEARMRQEELKEEDIDSKTLPQDSPWVAKELEGNAHHQRCTGEAVQCAMDLASFQENRTSRILLFTNGCPNLGEGSVVLDNSNTKKIPTTTKKKKKHDTIDDDEMSKALEFYDTLADLGVEVGIAVDVLCTGSMELGLPAYQALVEPSGGYVVPHSNLHSPHLIHNLMFLLHHTYVSRTQNDSEADTKAEEVVDAPKTGSLRRFFRRQQPGEVETEGPMEAKDCVVDIRSDSFVVPTHVVGPGELISFSTAKNGSSVVLSSEKAAVVDALELAASKDYPTKDLPSLEAVDLSMTRLRFPRYDPLATMSVLVQVDDSMEPKEDDHAFFQMTARFVSRDGKTLITRVSTHRLPVAESVSDYVKNADDEVISVLLGKNAVYRSIYGREETEDTKDKIVAGDTETLEKLAYEAQLDLDATIQRVSGAFRLLGLGEKTRNIDLEAGGDEKKESSPSALDFAFPPQLSQTLRRLYHLRRGALISPGPMQSMDDRAGVRQLFLRFPMEDCLGMMSPQLWSTGDITEAGTTAGITAMNPFPAETMALWDGSIIAADQRDIQFVWSGKQCSEGRPFEAIRRKFKKILMEKGKHRFPMPEIHMLVDGESMSRRFTTRLAPSHADPHEQQLANFPELSQLSAEALQKIRTRFRFYDAAADASFRKWFWSVSSATHASREDGMSLCE